MSHLVGRREFLTSSAGAVGALALTNSLSLAATRPDPLFDISLAQWSLHKAFFGRTMPKLDPLKFAEISKKEFDISALEYVNQFYKDKKGDDAYLKQLKTVADDNGVRSVLIMCDGEGNLGDPDEGRRTKAIENHKRWIEWAKFLGCHSIRVNAASDWRKGFDETMKLAADGLSRLTEVGAASGIAIIVENHGGLSSHGGWLAGVMKMVNNKMSGTLPDFGNFNIGKIPGIDVPPSYDRYKGVDELMPFAKGVSAKSHDFDSDGNETHTDYRKMMDIVLNKHKYRGLVGIEYEGSKLSEMDGIKATKKLLETVRSEMSKA